MLEVNACSPVISIDLSPLRLIIHRKILEKTTNPLREIERYIREKIYDDAQKALSDFENFKGLKVETQSSYNIENRPLSYFLDGGLDIWYINIISKWTKPHKFESIKVNVTGVNFESVRYGGGLKKYQDNYFKELKTQVNIKTTILNIKLTPEIFSSLIELFEPQDSYLIWYGNFISLNRCVLLPIFYDAIFGEAFICSCSESAYRKSGGIPNNTKIKESICHLCVAENESIDTVKEKYGIDYIVNKSPYIDMLQLRDKLDRATARAEVDRILKTNKWKNEALLYALVKEVFSAFTVIREFSPNWLGNLRIDIFIKELNVAIEYQGKQHYEPIKIFGGVDSLKRGKDRDERKKALCKENNVDVVYFTYKEKISEKNVRAKLSKYIPA